MYNGIKSIDFEKDDNWFQINRSKYIFKYTLISVVRIVFGILPHILYEYLNFGKILYDWTYLWVGKNSTSYDVEEGEWLDEPIIKYYSYKKIDKEINIETSSI